MNNIDEMRKYLVDKYGRTIRGQPVRYMSDGQVIAIYRSVINRKPKPPKLQEPKQYEQLNFFGAM